MKSNFIFILAFSLFHIPSVGLAEIKNKQLLMDAFQGCIREETPPGIKVGAHFEYCACFIKKTSLGMDAEEMTLLGTQIVDAKSDEEKDRIVESSKKLNDYIKKCVVKLTQ